MDPQVQANFNQVKGLLSKVLSQAAPTLPKVHFCVDMFDRPDSGTLGPYWTDDAGAWALVDNKVVYQLGTYDQVGLQTVDSHALVPGVNYDNTNAALSVSQAYGHATEDQQRTSMYKAKLLTGDMQARVRFTCVSSTFSQADFVYPNESIYNAGTITKNFYNVFLSGAGIGFGGPTSGRVLSFSLLGAPTPAIYANPLTAGPGIWGEVTGVETLYVPSHGFPAGGTIYGTYGILTPGANAYADMIYAFGQSIASATQGTDPTADYSVYDATTYQSITATTSGTDYLGTQSPTGGGVVVGTNELYMTTYGNVYSVYLNGSLIYSVTSKIMVDRAQVGFSTFTENLSALFEAFPSLTRYGVTSFKAWPLGAAEPPDQSGHGTYVDGTVKYSDKYHAVDGSYDPLA